MKEIQKQINTEINTLTTSKESCHRPESIDFDESTGISWLVITLYVHAAHSGRIVVTEKGIHFHTKFIPTSVYASQTNHNQTKDLHYRLPHTHKKTTTKVKHYFFLPLFKVTTISMRTSSLIQVYVI